MNQGVRRALVLGVALTGPTLAASCGGDDEAASELERFVDRIPASAVAGDGSPTFTYVDMSIRWKQFDLADASAEERLDAGVGRFAEPETFTILPQFFERQYTQLEESRDDVGFTAFDIDREAFVFAPPGQVFVVEVAVSPDGIDEAVRSDPVWSEDLDEAESNGETYYSWGEDARPNLGKITPLHSLGRGGQLAVEASGEGSLVTRTLDRADLEAALATAAGDEPSALDEGPLVPLLEGVGDGEVLQAFAMFHPLTPGVALADRLPPDILERLREQATLRPYDSIMAVELVDGDDTRTEILLAHGDEDAAEANVEILGDLFAEGLSAATGQRVSELFPDTSIERRGDVVVATVDSEGHFRRAVNALQQRDVFLTS